MSCSLYYCYFNRLLANNIIGTVSNGILSKFIGTGSDAYDGENVPITSSSLKYPSGLWVDYGNGDVYVSTYHGHRVQVITATTSRISTFAGNGSPGYSGDGGPATSATLNGPFQIFENNAALFAAESDGNRLRMIYSTAPTSAPTSPTVSPSATPSNAPSIPPSICPSLPPSTSPTCRPSTVRSSQNSIVSLAGTGSSVTTGTGGMATAASVNNPIGIWSDTVGYVYVSERGSSCIRKFSPSNNIIFVFAGVCGSATTYNGDNIPATSAQLDCWYISGNSAGTVYVGDAANNRARKIVAGVISTIAGTGASGTANSGNGGAATSAQVYLPGSVYSDTIGTIYITSYSGSTIRYVSSGIIYAFVGKSFL